MDACRGESPAPGRRGRQHGAATGDGREGLGLGGPGFGGAGGPFVGGCRADGGRRRRPLVHDAAHACGVVRETHDPHRRRRQRTGRAAQRADRRGVALLGTVEHGDSRAGRTRLPDRTLARDHRRERAVSRREALLGEDRRRPHAARGRDGRLVRGFARHGEDLQRCRLPLRAQSAPGARRARGDHQQQLRRHVDRGVVPGRTAETFRGFRPRVAPHARGAERHDDRRDSLQRHDLPAAQLRHQGFLLVSGLHERRTQHLLRREDGGDDRGAATASRSTTSRSLRWRTASRTWTARWCANSRPG